MSKPVKKSKSGIFPKITKKITSFAKGEKGKISKQSMITVGSIVGGAALGAAIASKITEGVGSISISTKTAGPVVKASAQISCEVDPATNEIICSHSHHASY